MEFHASFSSKKRTLICMIKTSSPTFKEPWKKTLMGCTVFWGVQTKKCQKMEKNVVKMHLTFRFSCICISGSIFNLRKLFNHSVGKYRNFTWHNICKTRMQARMKAHLQILLLKFPLSKAFVPHFCLVPRTDHSDFRDLLKKPSAPSEINSHLITKNYLCLARIYRHLSILHATNGPPKL